MGRRTRIRRGLLAGALCAALLGCAGHTEFQDVLLLEPTAAEQSTPLGGAALGQRKQDMQRAHRDMLHFHTTLESLQERKDRNGLVLFSQFLDAYMGLHLDPLLTSEWQSRHPELMALDANLRLVWLQVTGTYSGGVQVAAPINASVAPPGPSSHRPST